MAIAIKKKRGDSSAMAAAAATASTTHLTATYGRSPGSARAVRAHAPTTGSCKEDDSREAPGSRVSPVRVIGKGAPIIGIGVTSRGCAVTHLVVFPALRPT